ncbi:hypothetical protein [Streptomyces lydicus]|uniref:hypothetical protein n=1 Tax=Streptomyces lydicus TaxID=47763 RepID=UPI003718FB42
MAHAKRLNERQLALLRRICDSRTPVTSAEPTLATTVYALRNRGLVTTARKDGHWTAHATTAGAQYLAQADNPPSEAGPPADTTVRADTASATDDAAELIANLQHAGDVLRITNPTPAERARLRRALHAAKAQHLVPKGHYLQYTGRDTGDLVIKLLSGPNPNQITPRPTPLHIDPDLPPEELHPAVRDAPLPVCPDCQNRARRLLNALARAAQHKGHTVSPAPSDSDASLEITAYDSTFPLRFTEGTTEHLDPDSVQYSWQRVTARITRPSHDLDLLLPSAPWGHRGGRYRWGDRQRWRLEDKLHQILDEVEHRARAEHEQHLNQQRKEEDTRRRWQEAMEQARITLLQDRRVKALREQADAWNEAGRIRAYCDALDQHISTALTGSPEDQQSVTEWITWARNYADRIDPVHRLPGIPKEPPVSPEDLRPYLNGWSPYGPKRA